ncbi:MAG: hypothetical protein Q7L55_12810 [Actinomycetota bacterium]|nr:hypothetical protein [Actinomycetota bacterium]
MGTLVGTLLVLSTWLVCAVVLCSIGLLPAGFLSGRQTLAGVLRSSIWWGALTVTVFAYFVNLFQPLRSAWTAVAFISLTALLAVPGVWLLRKSRALRWHRVGRRHFWILWTSMAMAVGYLALAVLGPVTNYDSGLYHLGAIQYAGDFATIPGLANLYSALGYSNAEFPLAALLDNGPWDSEGFRLLNGLLIALVVLDFFIRGRQRRLSAGFFVLAVGLLAALVPMIALADYWVTSPTQDSTVLLVTIIASAYLADALTKPKGWVSDAATLAVLSMMLILLRPTMAVFAVSCLFVMLFKAWRTRPTNPLEHWIRASVLVGVIAVVVGSISAARDYVLSGWLEYPLSIFHFSVPWLAADPTPVRLATLGYHRDREHMWQSADGWSWIGSWFSHLPSQWESYQFAFMMLAAAFAVATAARTTRVAFRWRRLLLALIPSAVAILIWFFLLPPAFRFIWGPLFMLPATIIGWVLWRLYEQDHPGEAIGKAWLTPTVIAFSVPIVLVTVFSLVFRSDLGARKVGAHWNLGISIPYSVVPVRDVSVRELPLGNGLVIQLPLTSDQCWEVFPLCTPSPADALRLRGQQLTDGFLP